MTKSYPQVVRFKVIGRGHFPADMLRYDQCWPSTSGDAVDMFRAPRSYAYNQARTVELTTWGRPTVGRWQSFGWEVELDGLVSGVLTDA